LSDSPSTPVAVPLPHRGVLRLTGEDRIAFLQGLVSNDVAQAEAGGALHAAFLTPQGKFLHDLFVIPQGDSLLLECERDRAADLLRRLSMYRLRSKVKLEDASDRFTVHAAIGEGAAAALGLGEPGTVAAVGGGLAYADPRLGALGARLVLPVGETPPLPAGDTGDWDRLRLSLGVPDGSRDLIPEKSILLENGFDRLNGVSWSKGCYMGQELTARTKYRGLVKKRLTPVRVDGPLPEPGTPVLMGDKEIGEVRSGRAGLALALLRIEDLAAAEAAGTTLTAGGAVLSPFRPAWLGD